MKYFTWLAGALLLLAPEAIALSQSAPPPAVPIAGEARGGDRDCGDFSTQAEAQAFFEAHNPDADPHALDGSDDDGVACETLPCPCSAGSGEGPSGHSDPAKVVDLVDGDTLTVRVGGQTRDVRLLGIDTPESTFELECGGRAAARSLRRLLDRGDRVRIVRDRSQGGRDAFGRLLRYVMLDGRDVGRRQVKRGWAKVFVFDDPFRRLEAYRRAQRHARSREQGVWRLCDGHFHDPL